MYEQYVRERLERRQISVRLTKSKLTRVHNACAQAEEASAAEPAAEAGAGDARSAAMDEALALLAQVRSRITCPSPPSSTPHAREPWLM